MGGKTKKIVKQGKDKGKSVTGFHNVSSIKGRKYWWHLREKESANLNFNYLINEVGGTYIGDYYVSDNFHEIHSKANIKLFLNSVLFYLLQQNAGRVGFGGGLLKIQTYELKRIPIMVIDKNVDGLLKNIGTKSIFEECGINPNSETPIEEQEPQPLADRAELDKVVFDALVLTEEERKDVYRAVCRLVWNRISRAGSV